ncbi:hypothetical protein [Methylobacterium sp. 6HR-1]|uniref:Uncharacterized protein n=1 Tax=Methylobacterium nonmethylotrophicum TaxID=1141884 RepID=A0A4Z0NII6_9HYPH|nr:hypothetical protein EU555_27455 [Methylobacterium nonmethylotrophicum]
MKLPSLAAAAALFLAVTPALAQGTPAQRAACTSDAMRLCSSYIPNVGAIASCLRREKASLSAACRTVMDAAEAPAQRTAEAPRTLSPRSPAPRAAIQAAEPRLTPRTMVRSRAVARAETPVVGRRAVARRYATARPVYEPRRMVVRNRAIRYAAVRHRRGAGQMAGLAGFGGRSSEMRQAMYWMNRLGGLSGMMGGMAGMAGGMGGGGMGGGGMSLDAIRDMRIGDLMGLMQ